LGIEDLQLGHTPIRCEPETNRSRKAKDGMPVAQMNDYRKVGEKGP